MDPNFIGASEWAQLGQVIRFLGLLPLSAIVLMFSLALAHAIIPSLVASHHIPRWALRFRPFFYATSAAGAVAVVFVFATLIGLLDVVETIYKDWWI